LVTDLPVGMGQVSDSPAPQTSLDDPDAVREFARRVAASLSTTHQEALAMAFAACAQSAACYEASVRALPGQPASAGRMMIEQASPSVLAAIASTIGVALPPAAARWIELAHAQGVSIIAGWDLRGGGQERCVKLYFNASDAWRAAGARLYAAIAPGVPGGNERPAVVGMNVRADGIVETKLYVQSADAVTLANGLGQHAQALALSARRENADAGGVLSFDTGSGSLQPRAFFVALREPHDAAGWRCVQSLPGYDHDGVEGLLPFAPAPPRSVGVSLPGGGWTLYFKPRHSGRAPEALEPVAVFSAGDAEVGVFIEPTKHAPRAFSRTEHHAVTVRLRRGVPPPLLIEALIGWFTAQLRLAERYGVRGGPYLTRPPEPWRLVPDREPSPNPGARQ